MAVKDILETIYDANRYQIERENDSEVVLQEKSTLITTIVKSLNVCGKVFITSPPTMSNLMMRS